VPDAKISLAVIDFIITVAAIFSISLINVTVKD
jgi:hypothetical protein